MITFALDVLLGSKRSLSINKQTCHRLKPNVTHGDCMTLFQGSTIAMTVFLTSLNNATNDWRTPVFGFATVKAISICT